MSVALPTPYDYQQVLQHPRLFLGDSRLKNCKVETDPMGLPRVRSGGFALTYQLKNGNQKWALRCFHKLVQERDSRYAAICKYISIHQSDILVPVEFITQGVLVSGKWYPITIMEWVDGDTLDNFIFKNVNNSFLLAKLLPNFLHLVNELERLKISHGDLSQLNILVQNERLVLVDYDGMFVPELAGKKNNELGNINFQHPRRDVNDFDSNLDHFSEIVIYLTLRGLSLNPRLYDEFKGGEGLIFKRDDFVNPFGSKLLKELEKFSELKDLIRQFRSICQGDISSIPKLDDFLKNPLIEIRSSTSQVNIPTIKNQFRVIDANNHGTLLEQQGEYITVIGRITNIRQSTTRYGLPYLFLNFGDWQNQCFCVIMWAEVLDMLIKSGRKPKDYDNNWVAVTGILTLYITQSRQLVKKRPEIILESPTNIEILSIEDVKIRLTGESKDTPDLRKTASTQESLPPTITQNPISTVSLESVTRSSQDNSNGINFNENQVHLAPKSMETISQSQTNPIGQSTEIAKKLNSLYLDVPKSPKPNTDSTPIITPKTSTINSPKRFLERISQGLNKLFRE